MKRIFLIASAGLTILAAGLLPAVASAHRRGRLHHHRGIHARLESFGTNTPTAPASDNAGTITSFVGGVLTIKLNDGAGVAGQVTNATKLECVPAVPATMARLADHGRGNDEGSGDNASDSHGGPGPSDEQTQSPTSATEPGDDNGNDADDADGQSLPVTEPPAANDDNDEGPACDMTALTAGTMVRDAELRATSLGATFAEVKVIH
jgi:hypothetical protein